MSSLIDKTIRKVDAVEKANGSAKYIADMYFDGMLFGKLIRAKINRGIIKSIKLPKLPDGYFYISKDDIPESGINKIDMIKQDWPIFVDEEVMFYGQTIGLLVGPDKEILSHIENNISFDYEIKEAAITIEEGLICKGGAIHNNDNLFADYNLIKGDPEKAFKEAKDIIEEDFETGYQAHIYLEPQGMIGLIEKGKLTIYASCQCPFYLRKSAAKAVGKNVNDIVIKQTTVGGGFGGKENFPDIIGTALIVAVNKIKKPIKIIFDRNEDICFTSKRHPSKTHIKTALDTKGKIIAMDIDILLNAGAYESCSNVVLQRAIFTVNNVYDIQNIHIRGRTVATNVMPSDAMRGFGAPQAIFAIETHLSHIAKKLSMDSAHFKIPYFVKKGSTTASNGALYEDVKLLEMWEKIEKASNYNYKNNLYKRGGFKGIGASFYMHGGGFTGDGEQTIIKAHVKLKKHKNGKIEILSAQTDIGQGVKTTFSKIVAEILQIPLEYVIFNNVDTSHVPDSGPTVASRSILIVGKLIEKAAHLLKEKISSSSDEEVEVEVGYEKPPHIKWDQKTLQGDAYVSYSFGICVVEVEVNPITFEVETKGVWTIHDIGTPIDKQVAEGQICGAIMQALGYGGLEKLELKDGHFYQSTMTDYIIPTSLDFKNIYIDFIDNPSIFGPFGAKALGELGHNGAAAALVDAIQKAIDKNMYKIPATPEYIMGLINNEKH